MNGSFLLLLIFFFFFIDWFLNRWYSLPLFLRNRVDFPFDRLLPFGGGGGGGGIKKFDTDLNR